MQRFQNSKFLKISLIILIVCLIISHIVWGDLFRFPFDSNLWGNAADWCMVVVTAITARYIWQTLKSQTEVQADQKKLLMLEQVRITNDLMPSFDGSITGFTPHIYPNEAFPTKFGNSHYIFSIGIRFILQNSIAKDIRIELTHPNGTDWDDDGCENMYEFAFVNQLNGFDLGYNVTGALAQYTQQGVTSYIIKHRVTFQITYSDQLGNRIIQPIEYDIDTSATNRVIPHKPVVIKSIY